MTYLNIKEIKNEIDLGQHRFVNVDQALRIGYFLTKAGCDVKIVPEFLMLLSTT